VPAPKGLPSFYSFNEPIATKPGALIKSERLTLPKIHGTVYRVMYVSTTVEGKPTPVTGLIAVPNGTPPAGGFPVVSWGHGTNGMADVCAPSFKPDGSETAGLANLLLDKGWVLTASDYQGEGTPGMLPYIAGDSAARNTIDIVRAARDLPGAHASANYVVWGHSEGGQTAMFTDKIGPAYAPELHMKGVVAGAPPSQFNFIYGFLLTSPFRYYLIMAAGGLNTAYGDSAAPLDQILTPKGVALIPKLDTSCDVNGTLGPLDVKSLTKGDPFKNPLWKKVLEENALLRQESGAAAHDPGRQRRADPRRVDETPRRPPLRTPPGVAAVDISGPEPRGRDRAVGRRHDPLDRRPFCRRRQPRPVQADWSRQHRPDDL
jgi:hypothetical protein